MVKLMFQLLNGCSDLAITILLGSRLSRFCHRPWPHCTRLQVSPGISAIWPKIPSGLRLCPDTTRKLGLLSGLWMLIHLPKLDSGRLEDLEGPEEDYFLRAIFQVNADF